MKTNIKNDNSTELSNTCEPILDEVYFSVGTYSIVNENSPNYCHWSEGLKMVINKNGVTIKLENEEIEQLVKSLPRTIGGSY